MSIFYDLFKNCKKGLQVQKIIMRKFYIQIKLLFFQIYILFMFERRTQANFKQNLIIKINYEVIT